MDVIDRPPWLSLWLYPTEKEGVSANACCDKRILSTVELRLICVVL
jgi:hypothetical protein